MPGREAHNMFTQMVLSLAGVDIDNRVLSFINNVNKWIDRPHIILGKRHRVLFHSTDGLVLAYIIAKKYNLGFREALLAFLSHILLDKMDTMNKLRRKRKR